MRLICNHVSMCIMQKNKSAYLLLYQYNKEGPSARHNACGDSVSAPQQVGIPNLIIP